MQGNSLFTLLPFLIILLLFVPLFLNGRKQRRQMQETQAMQQALEAGDVVITTSGLRGMITDASYEDTIDIEIAEGVVTTWLRAAVRERVGTDEPAASSESTTEPAEDRAEEKAEEKAGDTDGTKATPGEGKPIIH